MSKALGDAVVAGVRISHPERVVYPGPGITKLDVARYYETNRRMDRAPRRRTPAHACSLPGRDRRSLQFPETLENLGPECDRACQRITKAMIKAVG